ncbi:hypothetical protein [Spiroplasma endosymbiont of Tricholauxania praeusta]|uniref:hypothetical protein n=1 Tax=Spiroplasma endosymbiont of Tricholauxania praeusta TaxID=3066296 RepID=UPI0030D063F5
MTNYLLSIDPSGTGTTAIFNKNDNNFELIKSENWLHHFLRIKQKILLLQNKLELIIYFETVKSAYNNQNADLVPLIKLCGALESYLTINNINYKTVTSDQVKRYVRWFDKIKGLLEKELTYVRNIKMINFCNKTGLNKDKNKWFYNNEKINAHQRDSILIYWIIKENK